MSTASAYKSAAAGQRVSSTTTTTQPLRVTGQTTTTKSAITTSFTHMTAVTKFVMAEERVEQVEPPMKVFFKPIPQIVKKYEMCDQQFVSGWCNECECCMDCCKDYIETPPDFEAPVMVAEDQPWYGH
ncbi:hypothetical protein BGZ47_009693 [Haplosporangium gracile]|nr:hypothetical protein BGZ47_009693 [Haplosporangium gracile]